MTRGYLRLFLLLISLLALESVTAAPAGSDPVRLYLPLVVREPLMAPYDMVRFLVSDGRLYEVQHSIGSQARHQTQGTYDLFFHTKGNELKAEWEELWATEEHIYRGTDTSPGDGRYYTLRDMGEYGSRWAPRFWEVGQLYERNPVVTFYRKSDCKVTDHGTHRSYLLFEAYYPAYSFPGGITLNNVVQLAWLLQPNDPPEERYYYAEGYGLVGWWSRDRGMSYISEIHAPGARPDNTREEIHCLDRTAGLADGRPTGQLPYWPGQHRR